MGDCLIGLAFMMEASTPFVSARAVLELLGEIQLGTLSVYWKIPSIFGLEFLGMKRSVPYMVNGIAMLVVFFFCRVLLMPYTYYLYGQQIGGLNVILLQKPRM